MPKKKFLALQWNFASKKSPFSLLEIVIAIVLLSLMAAVVGLRIGRGFEQRRFEITVGRLRAELESARRLAINMQADWILTLTREKNLFRLQRSCPELGQSYDVEWEAAARIFFNKREVLEERTMRDSGSLQEGGGVRRIAFHFSSTGKISPKGSIDFVQGENRVHWELPDLLGQTEE